VTPFRLVIFNDGSGFLATDRESSAGIVCGSWSAGATPSR
jgi:hypothetical protein